MQKVKGDFEWQLNIFISKMYLVLVLFTLHCCRWLMLPLQNVAKGEKMTETLAYKVL